MKSLLIRFVIGNTVGLGVNKARSILFSVIVVLRQALNSDTITGENRANLSIVVNALVIVSEFLSKLAVIVNAPLLPGASSVSELEKISDSLRDITRSL